MPLNKTKKKTTNQTKPNLEDLPEAIDDRDGWREKVREIRAVRTT